MKKRKKLTPTERARLGGQSGTGKAKARPAKVARAAAMARWLAYRAKKKAEVKVIVKMNKPEVHQLNTRDYGAIES